MTEGLEALARVWRQLDAMQAVLFGALLVLVCALSFALLRGVWDALCHLAAFIQSQTPQGKALAQQAAEATERERQGNQRRLQLERAGHWDGALSKSPVPPEIPRWLAIIGWVIGLVLGGMLTLGLWLIVRGAYQNDVVEFSFHNARVVIERDNSPIAFWLACVGFGSFSVAVAWTVLFEALPGLWRRVWRR